MTDDEPTTPPPTPAVPLIHARIIAIMRAVGPIAKDSQNTQQNYKFRGIDAVYNKCHPHFAEHGVFSTSEILESTHTTEQDKNGKPVNRTILKMRFTYFTEDGSSVFTEVVGEGMDYGGDKASNKAMSAADKYALLQLLKIPTAMIDSDKDRHDAPDADRSKPVIPPRADRVPPEQWGQMLKSWQGWMRSIGIEPTPKLFADFATRLTDIPRAEIGSGKAWTVEQTVRCQTEIDVEVNKLRTNR